MADKKVAFALGGLAGNNAHGAGFLQAALDERIEPVMISCTSGQLLWLHRYLGLREGNGPNLRDQLRGDIEKTQPFRNRNLDLATLGTLGVNGVYRPAYMEVLSDTFRNALDILKNTIEKNGNVFLAREALQWIPCRVLVPDFSDEFFESISTAFLKSKIGIVFNSYSPSDGHEYVYLNDPARDLLQSKRFDPGRRNPVYKDRTTYQEITPQAVRDGLWLYQYGFDQKENTFLDGAYFREIILSELTHADTIYVARPVSFHWTGHLPTSYPELEDLKTKVGFNGSYSGERYQIQLINKLLDDGAFSGEKQMKYHKIDLIEIEIKRQRGFFDYVFEQMDVFDDAFKKSLQEFNSEIFSAQASRP
jgi:hypothetical protein